MSGAAEAADILPFGGARGSNQTAVRAYNERLVLSLVRRHGRMAKVDIARSTGLSAQTVSVIMRSLESDGLLVRGEPKKGRVGQPSVPLSLDPNGAFSIGLKIGRRSADLVRMDFVGTILEQLNETFAYPSPQGILQFVRSGVVKLTAGLDAGELKRVAGIGIAAPFELWNWADEAGASQTESDAWRNFDLQSEVAALSPFPVFMENDATSACGAELVFGLGTQFPDFVYFFIGSFIGGGVVINSSLFKGKTGTAGALGSMPVPDGKGGTRQLIEAASISVLERMLREAGADPRALWSSGNDWRGLGAPLDAWIDHTAEALACAIVASASVIDFGAAIIDGGFPDWVRARIVQATGKAMGKLDLRGIITPEIRGGEVGSNARAIGGASLPLFSRYLLDFNSFLKETG
jgi:predicted NBD/HSP70 family sugar kinase